MPLTVSTFKQVAASMRTFKEAHEGDENNGVMTEADRAEILAAHPELDAKFVDQVITVRKGRRAHVDAMLRRYKDFRAKNEWPVHLNETHLNQKVVDAGPHDTEKCPETGMPMIVMHCGRIDVSLAPARDFQQHAQYLMETVTFDRPEVHERGIALRLDFKGASFAILRKLHMDDLTRGIDIFRTYPVKVKKVYLTNTSMAIRMAVKAVLMMATKNIRNKVVVVNN